VPNPHEPRLMVRHPTTPDQAAGRDSALTESGSGMRDFVSAPLQPSPERLDSPALSAGEPQLPASFRLRDETLVVREVLRTWRSTTTDRGDTYLARHWYEVRTADERTAVIYFDRKATRGKPRWWLYTIGPA